MWQTSEWIEGVGKLSSFHNEYVSVVCIHARCSALAPLCLCLSLFSLRCSVLLLSLHTLHSLVNGSQSPPTQSTLSSVPRCLVSLLFSLSPTFFFLFLLLLLLLHTCCFFSLFVVVHLSSSFRLVISITLHLAPDRSCLTSCTTLHSLFASYYAVFFFS